MKCRVMGGGGFIGSAVVAKLVEQGRSVVALEHFENPHYISDKIINGVETVNEDVRDLTKVAAAIQNCDFIYHFADTKRTN